MKKKLHSHPRRWLCWKEEGLSRWQPLNSRDTTVEAQTKQLAFTCAPNYKKKGQSKRHAAPEHGTNPVARVPPPVEVNPLCLHAPPLPSISSSVNACGHLPSQAAEAGSAVAQPWSRLFTSRLNQPRANSCCGAGCLSLATSPLLSASFVQPFVPNYGESLFLWSMGGMQSMWRGRWAALGQGAPLIFTIKPLQACWWI